MGPGVAESPARGGPHLYPPGSPTAHHSYETPSHHPDYDDAYQVRCFSIFKYIEFGSGSGILAQFGYGSRVMLSILNFEKEK